MRKLALSILVTLSVATTGWALSSISAYKTFTREVLTSSDLNSSFSTVISGVNNLIAIHPGDTTKTAIAAFDTFVANPGPNLNFNDPLKSKSANDSLNFHLANVERANFDTLQVGDEALVGTAYTAGSSAGSGVKWQMPYAQIDSLAVDSLTVNGDMVVKHTATAAGDEAMLIDVDAAGFAEIVGLEIHYETGAVSVGEEAVILIEIDQFEATGGEIVGMEVIATEGAADDVFGMRVGVGVAPIQQLRGTFENSDSSSVKTVDRSTEFNSTGSNIVMFVADNDTIIVGNTSKFSEIEFILATVASGAGVKPEFRYSTAPDNWTQFFPLDGTKGFRETGVIIWDEADVASWAVSDNSYFLIQIKRTANGLGTTPVEDKVQIAVASESGWNKNSVITVPRIVADSVSTDSLTVTAAQFFGTVELPAAGTKVVWIDTTITAMSAKKLRFVCLSCPQDVWFPGVADGKARYRQIEQGKSLNRVDGILHPAFAVARIATAGDTLSAWDMTDWTEPLVFVGGTNNVLHSSAMNDMAFLDGTYFVGTASSGTHAIDLLADIATRYNTTGVIRYGSVLSDRNASSGYVVYNASPAIVNNTVNAAIGIRSPWEFHLGPLGRRLPFFGVGTAGGSTICGPYNQAGDLSCYDTSLTDSHEEIALTSNGLYLHSRKESTTAKMSLYYSIFAQNGDAILVDEGFSNTVTTGKGISWTNGSAVSEIVILDGLSSAGNNSPKIVLGSNEGLYLVDFKATDAVSGCRREITSTFVSPPMCGDIRLAFSGASTADPSGNTTAGRQAQNNGTVTFVANTDGPGGHYGNFVAASSQSLTWPDNADFTFTTAFSGGGWFFRDIDSGVIEGLLSKYDHDTGTDQSFRFYIDASDILTFQTDANGDVVSVGPALSTARWYKVDATYDGANQRLYLNGELVDTDAQTGSLDDSSELLVLGAISGSGTPGNHFDGRIWGAFLTAEVLSATQIKAHYQEGLEYINSPTNDLLANADVDGLAADRYSGSSFLHWGNGTALRWEHRLPSGALLDTFACVECGSGTTSAGDLASWAGQDSMSFVMGAQSASRYIGPDVRLIDAAAHNLTWKDVTFESPVVVDSAGHGDFWTFDDAIGAAGNVGRGHIYAKDGTYSEFDADVATMTFTGESWDVVINGVADDAINIAAASIFITNMSIRTTPGGGNAFDAVQISSAGVDARLDHLNITASDDDAIQTAAKMFVSNSLITGADGLGFNLPGTGDGSIITGNEIIDNGSFGINIAAANEDVTVVGNRIFNNTNGEVADASGTSTVAANDTL